MLSKFSVKKPYTVLVGVVLVIILGIVSFTKMTADLLPNINLPYVIVMTTYPGANPETVEMVVTKPVEQSMATVSNIENISSVSAENYSMVVLEFAQNANMDSVSLEIRESLDQITGYWEDESIGNPIIMKLNPDMLPVMTAAVGVEGMTNVQVTDLTNTMLMPEIESIEGVASVDGSGLVEESVHVIIRQEKIDRVNQQVFGFVEGEFEEAEQEIADGRAELEKGQKELNSSVRDLQNSQSELNKNKADLESGLKEVQDGIDSLDSQKEDVAWQLAEAQTQINDAKNQISAALAQIESQLVMLDTSVATAEQTVTELKAIEKELEELRVEAEAAEAEDPFTGAGDEVVADGMAEIAERVTNENLKNTIKDVDTLLELISVIGYMDTMVAAAEEELATTKETVEANKKQLLEAKEQLQAQNEILSQKLTEVNMGEMLAAIEMGSGSATLNITKGQLESAKGQLESAQTQLDDAWDQIDDAKKQMKDGWKQLEDGEEELKKQKENALEQADMTNILTVETVKGLLAAQNFSMPAGYVTEDGVEYLVRVGDKPDDVESLSNLPLMKLDMDGVDTIYLNDVADVFMTDNASENYTNVNGNPGVILSIQKQTGYSTGDVSNRINEKFEELMAEDPSLDITPLMDQGIYIDLVMDSIAESILVGSLLAIVILIFFLRDVRPTLVVAVSIPISLVTALVCMYFSGVTLNIISLSGLALGIGMLVDNSIVVIENIYRMRSEGASMREAAIEGSKEVAGAILASTLTTVCVFVPIVFTEGMTRQLFVDMGLTIGYSLMASLVIALTVVPAMASKVLVKAEEKKESRFFGRMMSGYEKLLAGALKRKPLVVLAAVIILGLSILAALSNGTAFMEDMESTQISATVELGPGATLADTREVTDEVVSRLMTIEEVLDVGAMAGGDSMSLMSGGSGGETSTTIYITLPEKKERSNEEIANEILALTEDLEAEISVTTSSMDMSMLGGSGIQVVIKGRELDTLQELTLGITAELEQMEGLTDISNGLKETTGELRVVVDREKAIEKGLTVAQVFAELNKKLAAPSTATTLISEIKDYDVIVMNGEDEELTRDMVEDLVLTFAMQDGSYEEIPLKDIARFERAEGVKSISRDAQSRTMTVSAAIADGYNIGLVGADVQDLLDDYDVPAGYTLSLTGENETINEAMGQLMLMLVLAVAFMYLIMVAQFQSLLSPFIIMFTIPLAFTGGFLALFIGGFEVSVIAVIGFIMLAGVIVNNGIVIIDYMNQLRERGVPKFEAILTAGKTRLRPVLMTALTTILAMVPMVTSSDMGSDMAKPMAVVTIGGLLYGTLLTLFVIPCIYDWFMRERKSSESSM